MRREKVKFVSTVQANGNFFVRLTFENQQNDTYTFCVGEKAYNKIVSLYQIGKVFFAEWVLTRFGVLYGEPGFFEMTIPELFRFVTDDGEEF